MSQRHTTKLKKFQKALIKTIQSGKSRKTRIKTLFNPYKNREKRVKKNVEKIRIKTLFNPYKNGKNVTKNEEKRRLCIIFI